MNISTREPRFIILQCDVTTQQCVKLIRETISFSVSFDCAEEVVQLVLFVSLSAVLSFCERITEKVISRVH